MPTASDRRATYQRRASYPDAAKRCTSDATNSRGRSGADPSGGRFTPVASDSEVSDVTEVAFARKGRTGEECPGASGAGARRGYESDRARGLGTAGRGRRAGPEPGAGASAGEPGKRPVPGHQRTVATLAGVAPPRADGGRGMNGQYRPPPQRSVFISAHER